MFSDMALLERREERIKTQLRSAKATERDGLNREQALLTSIREQLENDVPVASGVITTENLEQAIERAGSKAGNRGGEAAFSAIEMANLAKSLSKKR